MGVNRIGKVHSSRRTSWRSSTDATKTALGEETSEERLDRVDTVIQGTAGPTDHGAEWQALVEEHYQVVAILRPSFS